MHNRCNVHCVALHCIVNHVILHCADVDLSINGGETWLPTTLEEESGQHPTRAWAWTFWSAEVPIPNTPVVLLQHYDAAWCHGM